MLSFFIAFQNYATDTETFFILSAFALLFVLAFIFKDYDVDKPTNPTKRKSASQFFRDLKDENNNKAIEAENKIIQIENKYKSAYPDAIVKVWKDFDKGSDDYIIKFSVNQSYQITKNDLLNYANTSIDEGLFIGKNNNSTSNHNGVLVHLNECLTIEGKNIYISKEVAKSYINIILENFKALGKEYEIVEDSYGNYFNRETDYNWTLHPKSETFSKGSRRIYQAVKDKVWKRDEGKCTQCGSREKLEFDHIIPHSKGGSNTYRNVQLLCEKCNRSKSDKIG